MPGQIQSVERAAAIMTLLAGADGTLSLAEIAAAIGLPKTTTHGIVATLRSVGWIDQAGPSAGYRAAGRLAGLAQSIDAADLRSVATPWMDRLASETGLAVHLVRHEGGRGAVVQHVYRPDNTPQRLIVGETLPLHATASGKILSAFAWPAPDTTRHPLEQFTRFTLTHQPDLDAELAQVITDGHAAESGEFYPEVHSLAAPVRDAMGRTVAAVAVLGRREDFASRDRRPREPLTSLLRAAGFVSRAVASLP